MQAVAAEMNLSETAFLVATAPARWNLRWFTPTVEVDLCGHATLAAAHVLWTEQGVGADKLHFATRGGELSATRHGDAIGLQFPSDPPSPTPAPDGLAAALGVAPTALYRGRYDLLAVLDDPAVLVGLEPDMAALARIDARGLVVTTLSDDPAYDFLSRFFAPGAGIPEDPVTGSAHCTLGPFWGERLGKTALRGWQASQRGGAVGVRLLGERVELLGQAVVTLRGRLQATSG